MSLSGSGDDLLGHKTKTAFCGRDQSPSCKEGKIVGSVKHNIFPKMPKVIISAQSPMYAFRSNVNRPDSR
jgi:hypothetical protein